MKFPDKDPTSFEYILKIKTGLRVENGGIEIVRDKLNKYKELLITYKTEHLNTYNIQVLDMSTPTPVMIYKIETDQLWESRILGLNIPKS